jgi:hypothetical protein
MSFDKNDDYYYAFDGMYFNYEQVESEVEDNINAGKQQKEIVLIQKQKNELMQHLSGYESNFAIQKYLLKKILSSDEKYMIMRYATSENLPEKYLLVAEKKDGLITLIKGFLKHIAKLNLDEKVVNKIQKLVADIYANNKNQIVYYRVAMIRTFLYQLVDDKYGSVSGQRLPVNHTKNILSACRLHLNLHDMKNKSSVYIEEQIILNKQQYDREMKTEFPSRDYDSTKRFIPHWKARHMKTLMYFNLKKSREVRDEILTLDINIPRENYIKRVTDKVFAKLENDIVAIRKKWVDEVNPNYKI